MELVVLHSGTEHVVAKHDHLLQLGFRRKTFLAAAICHVVVAKGASRRVKDGTLFRGASLEHADDSR